uniref:Uncharacterized protein n=1 Tax=Anguilla anguilla TaxID=7936 RepID=A0A0E9RR34_ANGAN
MTYLCNSAREH